MTRRDVFTTRLLIGAAGAALMIQPAFAQSTEEQETDEEAIVVTATKRASTVQDVPFSINAQSQEDIQRSNAQNGEDLSRNIAGLTVQNLGPGQSQVSIRGVSAGQIVRDQPGVKEQVGVYLDESVISLSLFTPDVDLYDLNRVETLRGPQGTLFGSGSVGGTLRYITNQPRIGSKEASFELTGQSVSEDDIGGSFKGMVNMDLGENAAARFVGYFTHFPGFIDNVGPGGGENINDGQRIGGRMSFLFEPTPQLSLSPRILYQKIETNGFNRQEFFSIYQNEYIDEPFNDRQQHLLLREGFEDETMLIDMTANYDFGGVELTSVSSYLNRDILVSRDASALTHSVSIDLGLDDDAYTIPSNLRDTTDLEQFTQEIRISSTGSGPLQWVLGGFYSDVNRQYRQRLPTPGYDAFSQSFIDTLCFDEDFEDAACRVNDPDPANRVALLPEDLFNSGLPYIMDSPYNADLPYDFQQFAVFGEASYEFNDFILTVGGRYYDYKEERDFISGGLFSNGDLRLGDSTESSGFTPRFILSYEPSNNLRLNAQVSKGFRLGGVNDPLNVPLCSDEDEALFGGFQNYDDETLWNYEAGVKYSNSRFTANVAGFYTDINNLQVTLDAGSCSSRVVFNTESAHTMGLEAEFAARVTDSLDLSVSGSWVEAEFDTTLPEPLATATGIRDGNRLPTVPEFQMAASAYYEGKLNRNTDWFLQATVQHVGSRFTQPADQENNPRAFEHGLAWNGLDGTEVTTVDLTLPSYELVNLSAGLKLDRGYEVVLFANNIFDENALLSLDRERGGRARLAYNIGTPRTIGITLRRTFFGD